VCIQNTGLHFVNDGSIRNKSAEVVGAPVFSSLYDLTTSLHVSCPSNQQPHPIFSMLHMLQPQNAATSWQDFLASLDKRSETEVSASFWQDFFSVKLYINGNKQINK
jgi:hypothetical protein